MAGLTKEQQDVLNSPARRRDVLKQIEYIAASGQSDDFEGDVGPWMNTPLGKEAKSAWDRGMSKRKSEDNRDIWDKALSTGEKWAAVPVVAGGLVGAASGLKAVRKFRMKGKNARAEVLGATGEGASIGGIAAPAAFMGGTVYEGASEHFRRDRRRRK